MVADASESGLESSGNVHGRVVDCAHDERVGLQERFWDSPSVRPRRIYVASSSHEQEQAHPLAYADGPQLVDGPQSLPLSLKGINPARFTKGWDMKDWYSSATHAQPARRCHSPLAYCASKVFLDSWIIQSHPRFLAEEEALTSI